MRITLRWKNDPRSLPLSRINCPLSDLTDSVIAIQHLFCARFALQAILFRPYLPAWAGGLFVPPVAGFAAGGGVGLILANPRTSSHVKAFRSTNPSAAR